MDLYTLAVVTCLSAAFMALGMGALYWASRGERALLDWALAGVLFFVNGLLVFLLNGLLGLFASDKPLVTALALGVANACTAGGQLAVLSGLRRHLGRPHCLGWALGLGVLVVAVHALPGARSVEARLLIMLPLLLAISLTTVLTILRSPSYRWRSALTGLLVVELLYALQLSARIALVASHMGAERQILGSDLIQTFGRLSMFMFIALSSAACALMVIRKQALALRQHAETDPMTGWLNRWTLAQVLGSEFERARRTGAGFHLVTFDIDHFKRINDQHGHAVGDQAIRHVTALVAHELRGYDQKFRIGGEEFVICVPGQPGDVAAQVAERLRLRVERTPLTTEQGPVVITVSVGHAGAQADDPDWEAVLKRADLALYQAKQGGRNRVVAASATGRVGLSSCPAPGA